MDGKKEKIANHYRKLVEKNQIQKNIIDHYEKLVNEKKNNEENLNKLINLNITDKPKEEEEEIILYKQTKGFTP